MTSTTALNTVARITAAALVAALLAIAAIGGAQAAPALGGALPGTPPLFPADNWWNTDVSGAPVDPGSAAFIAFINNGGQRRLHPDFGGEVSDGSVQTYGMPYAVWPTTARTCTSAARSTRAGTTTS